MADLLVKLYEFNGKTNAEKMQKEHGVRIIRAMTPNKHQVMKFIKDNFGEGWASESEMAFGSHPVKCFIAVNEANEIVGFGCYDATYKAFFGPTGVRDDYRKKGIGAEILIECLNGLKEMGYAYAFIGDASEHGMGVYKKIAGAEVIPGTEKSIYKNLI